MSWNGVTGTPRFSGTGDLKIFGSLSLDPNMLVNYSGRLNFESPIAGNTINTLQHQFNNIYFNGSNSCSLIAAPARLEEIFGGVDTSTSS